MKGFGQIFYFENLERVDYSGNQVMVLVLQSQTPYSPTQLRNLLTILVEATKTKKVKLANGVLSCLV